MYKELVRPYLDTQDSETWHIRARELLHLAESNPFTLKVLERMFAYKGARFTDPKLNVVIGGVSLENPLLVGAGWDKNGVAVKSLYKLGFAGVEVGSVLEYPQEGNEKPRQFMLSSDVSLNRLGFNSPGMEVVARNLEKYRKNSIPIGISLGKNKNVPNDDAPEAHAAVAKRLYNLATYFIINVSSPNSPNLRKLQDKEPLSRIVKAVNWAMDELGPRKPLFVKIAPELTDAETDDIIDVVLQNKLTGIIATNTTTNLTIKDKYIKNWKEKDKAGGLSGNDPDFREMATAKIELIYRHSGLNKLEIIGVGGVMNARTALEKMAAGARVVQIVTGIRGEGTALPGRINRDLVAWMEKEGIKSINEIAGLGLNNLPKNL